MRKFILALIVLLIPNVCYAAYAHFSVNSAAAAPPANANIPVASLTNGTYAANNWTGFTTQGTTVNTNLGFQRIFTTTNATLNTTAIGTGIWRDEEITFYFTQGRAFLRSSQGGSALVMDIGVGAPAGDLRIGMVSSVNYSNPAPGTMTYATYLQPLSSSCITNWPTDASHTFTFGVRGFEVYLLIDGVQAYDTCQKTELNPTGAIRYYDYRPQMMQAGQVAVQSAGGVSNQITATYYPLTALRSNYIAGIFDPRDFGMRAVPVGTGSMASGSCTLTLSTPMDIRVNERVIVELGGEAGAGAYNTIGVGGSSPELHYATDAARSADTTQPSATYAYIDTDGTVKKFQSGVWAVDPLGGYYTAVKAPVALIASVAAVNASPATTLTLATFGANYNPTCAKVATTNANVYLDVKSSFYPLTTNPASNFSTIRNDGLTAYPNMTINVPAGTWYMSGAALAYRTTNGDRTGLRFQGAGQGVTIFKSPKGVSSALFNANSANSNIIVQDLSYIGNRADGGYMWDYTATTDATGNVNKNYPGDPPVAILGGNNTSDNIIQRIDCLNDFRGCAILLGSNDAITNSQVVNTERQRTYLQWEFMLVTSTGGINKMENLTATSPYLFKAFNCFNANPCLMNNVGGTNVLLAINGGSSSTITGFYSTIQPDSYADTGSGWLDEGVVQINNNNGGGGSGGTISGFRIIHNGYTQVSSQRSLASIQIGGAQNNWTVSGSYNGVSGCTSALPGYIEYNSAPYSAFSGASYGAMGVQSSRTNITVDGIRVVGSAIGSPGHSGLYSNIAVTGAGGVVQGNVADTIQPGPTGTGNRTNATFCP